MPATTSHGQIVRKALERFKVSISELGRRMGVSEQAIRRWLAGGGITPTKREAMAAALGFDSWGQLERFLIPLEGEIYVLKHFARDLGRVWEFYLEQGATPIFETKIALSFERPLTHGFSEKANTTVRRKINDGGVTVHRVEQPRSVQRLAELAANALYFKQRQNYALRIVPPQKQESLLTYPNFIRFGKKALLLGRTHKIGAPGANDPLVLVRGEAAAELGDHLENALWNDANARVFSTIDENERTRWCRELATALDGEGGAHAFDAHYRDLIASTQKMERLRI